MGHSLQAVSLLVQAAQSVFALPLAVRIHEGLVWSNRDRRTLLDKMLALLGSIAIQEPFYFVADAYYAARKIVTGLLKQGNHLVTRMNPMPLPILPTCILARAKEAGPVLRHQAQAPITVQRPAVHASGREPRLRRAQRHAPLSGHRLTVASGRPAGALVAVMHPSRGSCLLMCTDTSLSAIEIIASTACASRSSTASNRRSVWSVRSPTISGCKT